MKVKIFTIVAALLLLVGCAASPPIWIQAQFDPEQARALMKEGPYTISGSGFLRQSGGKVVTCAGSQVALVPVTPYAEARISAIYGNTEKAMVRQGISVPKKTFTPDEPEYHTTSKSKPCDAQGNFKFDKVANGQFFVTVAVLWQTGAYTFDGGFIMSRVVVNGENTEVMLTH